MTATVDLRARALAAFLHPGNPADIPIVWPTGSLAGRTFTSSLDGQAVGVEIAGDTMTIAVSAAATAALTVGQTARWELVETTGADDVVLLAGRWATSRNPADAVGQAFTIVLDDDTTVLVDVTGQAALDAHELDDEAHGDPLGALQTHRDRLHLDHVIRPAAWGSWWRTARDDADSRIVRVQVWSDSIGAGSSATNPLTEGWVELVAAELQDRYGDGGTGYLPWWRATQTGSWTSAIGFGGGQGTASAAATLTFSSLRGTEIRFWYQGLNITGSFRWRIDGGSWTTVTTPTGALTQSAVVATGLADTTHTFEVERLSGSIVAYGLEARRSTGVIMQRCAHSGRAMGDYSPVALQKLSVGATNASTTITSVSPGAFTSSLVGRYITSTQIFNDTQITAVGSATSATISRAAGGTGTSQATISVNPGNRSAIGQETIAPAFGLIPGLDVPDVVILLLGANDGANSDYDERTWLDGAANLLRSMTNSASLTYSPDLIVGIEHFGTWFDTNQNVPALAAAMADFASGNGGALVDVWGMGRRSWNYWDDLGYFADQIHPTTAGHAQYAAPFIDLLTSD